MMLLHALCRDRCCACLAAGAVRRAWGRLPRRLRRSFLCKFDKMHACLSAVEAAKGVPRHARRPLMAL